MPLFELEEPFQQIVCVAEEAEKALTRAVKRALANAKRKAREAP